MAKGSRRDVRKRMVVTTSAKSVDRLAAAMAFASLSYVDRAVWKTKAEEVLKFLKVTL